MPTSESRPTDRTATDRTATDRTATDRQGGPGAPAVDDVLIEDVSIDGMCGVY